MIAQDGAGSLDLIDKTDQARHRRHFWMDPRGKTTDRIGSDQRKSDGSVRLRLRLGRNEDDDDVNREMS